MRAGEQRPVQAAVAEVHETAFPLVTIGMPTYNRARSLRRAAESALAQDYPSVEIVISDNGSTDETAAVCAELAARDPRVRVIRHAANRGVTENFVEVRRQARGELFMWLSDDDWIDPGYVRVCVGTLLGSPGHALVGGAVHYHKDGVFHHAAPPTRLLDASPVARVTSYLREVEDNGIFHGVGRTDVIRRQPFHHMLGADWLIVASMANAGTVTTIGEVAIHRSMAGGSWSPEGVMALYGLSARQAQNPYGALLRTMLVDVLWRSRAWQSPRLMGRLFMAVYACITVWKIRYAPLQRRIRAARRFEQRSALRHQVGRLPFLLHILQGLRRLLAVRDRG